MTVFNADGYEKLIGDQFTIVDKSAQEIPFILKRAQSDFLHNLSNKNIILKARQLGFSSVILAVFTSMFLYKENQRLVVVSHESSATQKLMDRVKFFIRAWERSNNTKLPTTYNSRSELVNKLNNSTIYIGTAGSSSFGRGDTITALHLSEFAFYQNPEEMLAGVLQALTPDGLMFIETTANGFNFFKQLWDESSERGFKDHFYDPLWEYTQEELERKKRELGRLFTQEYPMTPQEAFLTSGDLYFDPESLRYYLEHCIEKMHSATIYS